MVRLAGERRARPPGLRPQLPPSSASCPTTRSRSRPATPSTEASLDRALRGVDAAYYLIHSLGAKGNLEDLERRSAESFREACIEAGVKRVIYLGGLGEKGTASAHLKSRLETGEVLSARPDRLNVLWFRAGVVIGSGSAGFEIVRNLVQKLPLMITPRWVGTRTQPIGIEDVLAYLRGAWLCRSRAGPWSTSERKSSAFAACLPARPKSWGSAAGSSRCRSSRLGSLPTGWS